MTTALLTHPSSYAHVTPPGHPERVARIEAIDRVLAGPDFAPLLRREAPPASDAAITRAHPPSYLERLRNAAPESGSISLDADTHMTPGSLEAALRAAGGNMAAVDMVMAGEAKNAFVAMRPPGHHAEGEVPMGFCLFGSVVIGAMHALDSHGLERVAIVDFDVHHGNGTQDLVWDEPRILFGSTHQMPLYPGTGAPDERGGHNNVVNVPLPPGGDGALFRAKMEAEILPRVDAFKPDLVMISAGFDAHRDDPLANLMLVEADFVWATRELCGLADTHCDGRVVSTLEGGYDLDALAASVAAHVAELMERGA